MVLHQNVVVVVDTALFSRDALRVAQNGSKAGARGSGVRRV
jgi:hypothetical protein